jgi:hypothetical protein
MNIVTTSPLLTRLRRTLTCVAATGAVLALAGCSLANTAPVTDPFSSTGTLSGVVHGGQQPIYNATVSLYAAGTSGYGSASTLLATTKTSTTGGFQFTKLANGSSNSGSSWSCPASDPNPDPQIYLVASGGNTQGTGVTTTNNAAAVMMAAIGPCSGVTTSTQVQINEITSVATIFALSQYINPGTTPGTESVGTNGANTTSSTPQGAVGLNNAVSTIQNLANISTGQSVTSQTYTGTNASVTGVTVTATPEAAKIITIANIIAACINSTSSSSSSCSQLFAAATPPPSASVTSQPGTTFGTAQDTLQAAYYMAVNPINAGTQVTSTSCPNASSNMNCLFNLASTIPPFVGGLATQPTDWTIGITFTAAGACTHDSPDWIFFDGPAKVAVDATGNLWFVNGNTGAAPSTSAPFGGISPLGKPLACEGYSSGAGQYGAGIAVDPSGNIWASYYGSSSTNPDEIQELPASLIATATEATLWQPPFSSYALTVDGGGNVFFSSGFHTHPGLGGQLYELPDPGATSYTPTAGGVYSTGTAYSTASIFPSTLVGTGYVASTAATTPAYIAADHSGDIWVVNIDPNDQNIYVSTPTSLTVSGYSVASGNAVTFYTTTAPPASIVTGQNIVVTGLSSTEGLMIDHQGYTVTSIHTGTPYSITATLIASPSTMSNASTASPTSPTLGTTTSEVTDSGTLTGYTDGVFVQPSSNAVYGLAVDSNGYLYTGGTCCEATDDSTLIKITPNATVANSTYTVSAQYIGGLNGVRALALDGADNIWFSSVFPSTGTTANTGSYMIGEVSSTGSGSSATFNALSPAGTAPSGGTTCFTTPTSTAAPQCATGGGFVKSNFLVATDLGIDPSGNVWVPATGYYVYSASAATSVFTYNGTSITEVVGAAVPVVTPLSVAAGNGTLATKP